MQRLTMIGLVGLGLGCAQAALAQTAVAPEDLTVEASIPPGENVFSLDQSWRGTSRINVLAAEDLKNKGNITPGLQAQMALTADGKTLYTLSNYPRRIVFGPTESVIQEWDVATLSLKREIAVEPKVAMVEPQPAMLAFADGEKYLLAQNATPAASVTVIDLAKGAPIAEIPTPGCWGAIPAASGPSFLALCGDGSMQTYAFAADGSFSEPKNADGIFDPDGDALFTNPARAGEDLLFASFKGNIHRVSVKDGAPALVDKFSIVEGVPGDWAPGGSEVIAYHPETDTIFVLMHPDAAEGSHKDGAKEIWAVDLSDKKVLYRSVAEDEKSIAVSRSAPPVLFLGSDDTSSVTRYEVDPEARSAAKLTATAEKMGEFVGLVLTSQ